MRKHLREITKIAEEFGGTVGKRGNAHYMVELPNGKKITTAASPKRPEISLKNLRQDIRKYGGL